MKHDIFRDLYTSREELSTMMYSIPPASHSDKQDAWDETEETDVTWAKPLYTRNEVNTAGQVIINPSASTSELDAALNVVNNWRGSHSFPLNTLQNALRKASSKCEVDSLIAQRIKRFSSIESKLRRIPSMKLSQIQDIGGCRAIVVSINDINVLETALRNSQMKHKLQKTNDYIANPKDTGYRGKHLIYQYNSDRSSHYNDLKIEIQLRSQLQHLWATAVETVSALTRQALKSSQGEKEWLRFFVLMGTAFALEEHCQPISGTPQTLELLRPELTDVAERLGVLQKLRTFATTINILPPPEVGRTEAHYYLIELDAATGTVKLTSFLKNQFPQATEQYAIIERKLADNPGLDAVLVSVQSVDALKKAYPNYFYETGAFTSKVANLVKPR